MTICALCDEVSETAAKKVCTICHLSFCETLCFDVHLTARGDTDCLDQLNEKTEKKPTYVKPTYDWLGINDRCAHYSHVPTLSGFRRPFGPPPSLSLLEPAIREKPTKLTWQQTTDGTYKAATVEYRLSVRELSGPAPFRWDVSDAGGTPLHGGTQMTLRQAMHSAETATVELLSAAIRKFL